MISMILMMLLNSPVHALEAPAGMQAVVCYENGAMKSAELLDLYEARELWSETLETWDPAVPYMDIVKEIDERLDKARYRQILVQDRNTNLVSITAFDFGIMGNRSGKGIESAYRTKILAPGEMVQQTHDYNTAIVPKVGCEIQTVATEYDDSGWSFYSGDAWNVMNNVNKAALVVGYSMYGMDRIIRLPDSDHARRSNGMAFSNFKFVDVAHGLPKKFQYCSTATKNYEDHPQYQFLAFEGPTAGKVTLQFLTVNWIDLNSKGALVIDKRMSPFSDSKDAGSWSGGMRFRDNPEEDLGIQYGTNLTKHGKVQFYVGTDLLGKDLYSQQFPVTCKPGKYEIGEAIQVPNQNQQKP